MDVTQIILSVISVVIVSLMSCIAFLFKSLQRANNQHAKCEQRLAKVEIDLARITMFAETRFGDDFADAVVHMDASTGLVVEWNQAATILFGWNSREMFGKPVTRLIPLRYREKHLDAIQNFLKHGGLPRRGPHKFHALHKDGAEVAIIVLYAAWDDNGRKVAAAYIRKRPEEQEPDEASDESTAG